jgi:hypothetical protein
MREIKPKAVVLFAVLGAAVFLGPVWLDHTRETTLPTPTGPFAVGRASYVWLDRAQTDPMVPQPGIRRELLAWIWYPAAPRKPSQAVDAYLPAPWRTAVEQQRGVLIKSPLVMRDADLRHCAHRWPPSSCRNGALHQHFLRRISARSTRVEAPDPTGVSGNRIPPLSGLS